MLTAWLTKMVNGTNRTQYQLNGVARVRSGIGVVMFSAGKVAFNTGSSSCGWGAVCR